MSSGFWTAFLRCGFNLDLKTKMLLMSPKGLPVKEISSLQVLKLVTFNRLDSTKLVTSSNFFFGEESVRRKEIGKNCWPAKKDRLNFRFDYLQISIG